MTPEQEAALGYDDAVERLQNAGMEPISDAPRDREITVVLDETLKRQRVFWQDDIFGEGCWMDAYGDGATDSIWHNWRTEELIGWLPNEEPTERGAGDSAPPPAAPPEEEIQF